MPKISMASLGAVTNIRSEVPLTTEALRQAGETSLADAEPGWIPWMVVKMTRRKEPSSSLSAALLSFKVKYVMWQRSGQGTRSFINMQIALTRLCLSIEMFALALP